MHPRPAGSLVMGLQQRGELMSGSARGARHSALLVAAALAAAACHPGNQAGEPQPDPGPSMPPEAVAAAEPGTITEGDHNTRPARIEELLRGRFAGVEVIPLPGGGMSVRIRGASSASSEPLYVLDGTPVQPEPGGALRWLSPNDVAKIEVLKDIGATAFYGSRGANGVILITTKGG
jgi:TonB-dependent SusC/RagA subfamily outer membrane receptor